MRRPVRCALIILGIAVLGGGGVSRFAGAHPQQAAGARGTTALHSLGATARHIRLRWPNGRKTLITNANLPAFSKAGALTSVISTAGRTQTRIDHHAQPSRERIPRHTKKEIWQTRYRALLTRIAVLKHKISYLDTEIPHLWNMFYAWDDPAYRDSVIKPKLDRALVLRKTLRRELRVRAALLPTFLENARKHNVPPGWLREVASDIAASTHGREGNR